jgi:uncharacterized protein YecE (DUF72 family)
MVLCGTCGYSYKEWEKVFYPEGMRNNAYLHYYAGIFPALEIDSTFYRMPTPFLLSKWKSQAPDLRFCLKAPRTLTHEISDWKGEANTFSIALDAMGENLAAVLFQFPQSFHRTEGNRLYLASLLDAFASFPKVVEFRHKEWGIDRVFESLDKRNTGFCVCDMPSLSALPCFQPVVTGGLGYVRFHGRNDAAWYGAGSAERYAYTYSAEELKKTLPIIRAIDDDAKETYLFFNNHPGGGATVNARTMMYLLKE